MLELVNFNHPKAFCVHLQGLKNTRTNLIYIYAGYATILLSQILGISFDAFQALL